MPPKFLIRMGRCVFQNAATMCQGGQIGAIIIAIGNVRPDLTWYVSDVRVIGPSLVKARRPVPEQIGDTATLTKAVNAVAQFESGVFVGVPRRCLTPTFRFGGLWTEDDEAADLADALVEIRAFDTTYVSVATNDAKIADRILEEFVGAERISSP
jgi:hypothetical protein